MNLPVTPLPLGAIEVDDSLQPRSDGLSEEHVLALMETPEDWPPIMVAHVDDANVLIDGFHRHDAARRLGYESIAAKVFYPDQNTDLFRIAFSLNIQHGRPLTRRDRNAYAAHLLQRYPELSDREIGRRCGLHHETVGAIRNRRTTFRAAEHKPGALPGDVGLLDPIRRAKATRAKDDRRLRRAPGDRARRSFEDGSSLDRWPDDPAEIAEACVAAMGPKRARETLHNVAIDARFMLSVAKAAQAFLQEAS